MLLKKFYTITQQRRYINALLPSSRHYQQPTHMQQTQAAIKLQRAWRRTLRPLATRTYADAFQRLNLGTLPRRALLERISLPTTTETMELLLDRLRRLCSIVLKLPGAPLIPCNTLKHAYISAVTSQSFKNGVSDQIAKTRRARLLQVFDEIVRGLPTLRPGDIDRLLLSFTQYGQSTQQQQLFQLPQITVQSQRVLLSLYGALEQLRDDPDHAETRIALKEKIGRVRITMGRLVQPAAMARFDAERATAGTTRALQVRMRSQPMDNEVIGHELCLDLQFQLRVESSELLLEPVTFDPRIRDITGEEAMRAAIADEMQQTPPIYGRLLQAFAEVRSSLMGTLANQPLQVADLNAALNVNSIRVDLARWGRVRDLGAIGRAVMRIVGGDATRWNAVPTDDAAAVAAFLVQRAHEQCIAAANERVRQIAPLFNGHSYEYERQKFQERLDGGLETPIARRWVRRPAGVNLETAHSRAFASLVAGPKALNLATLPETLVHDLGRVERFRNEFASILRAAFEAAVARRGAAPGTPAFRALTLVYAEPTHPAHRLLRGAMRKRFLLLPVPLPAFVDAERFAALARDVEAVRALDFNTHSVAYGAD